VFTFSIKCIFRTVVENIWMAGRSGERSRFYSMLFSLVSRSSLSMLMLRLGVSDGTVGDTVGMGRIINDK